MNLENHVIPAVGDKGPKPMIVRDLGAIGVYYADAERPSHRGRDAAIRAAGRRSVDGRGAAGVRGFHCPQP